MLDKIKENLSFYTSRILKNLFYIREGQETVDFRSLISPHACDPFNSVNISLFVRSVHSFIEVVEPWQAAAEILLNTYPMIQEDHLMTSFKSSVMSNELYNQAGYLR
jgi:hypothetical protein